MGEAEPYVTLAAQETAAPLRELCALTGPGATVLEVGCGNGEIGASLQEHGAIVDGIEPSPERAAVARTRLRYVSQAWAPAPGVRDEDLHGAYDLITFIDVLEHLPDPVAALDWAVGRLASGGAIFAMIANSGHWWLRWKMLTDRDYAPDGGLFDRRRWIFNPEAAARLRPALLVEESVAFSSVGRWSHRRLVAFQPRLFATHVSFVWRAPE